MPALYPASVGQRALFARGHLRLVAGYDDKAVGVYNNNGSGTYNEFGFAEDSDALDNVALDAHIGSFCGRITKRFDQTGNGYHDFSTISDAPRISDVAIGGHRAAIFDGGAQTGVGGDTELGRIYSLVSSGLGPLGAAGDDFTYMALMQFGSSIHCNQAGAPGLHRGTLINFAADGADLIRIQSDGLGDDTIGGFITVKGADGFSYTADTRAVQATPVVLTVTSRDGLLRVSQNGIRRVSPAAPANATAFKDAFLGRLEGSVAGAASEALQAMVLADMLWAPGLTVRQEATREAMLYRLAAIDFRADRSTGTLIIVLGDSNAAEYKAGGERGGGLYGYAKLLPGLLSRPVRLLNFAVPGSTTLYNGDDTFPANVSRSYVLGRFFRPIAQALAQHRGPVVVIYDNVGNSFGNVPNPSAADEYAGHQAVYALIRAVKPSAKIIDCCGTIHFGASYTDKQLDTNQMIRDGAAANDIIVADYMANAILSTNPGAGFLDSGHRSTLAHQVCAGIHATLIETALGW
ncbi:MAG: GDSL-type esterase/lipase family protein [Pseudolabrys sp.]